MKNSSFFFLNSTMKVKFKKHTLSTTQDEHLNKYRLIQILHPGAYQSYHSCQLTECNTKMDVC